MWLKVSLLSCLVATFPVGTHAADPNAVSQFHKEASSSITVDLKSAKTIICNVRFQELLTTWVEREGHEDSVLLKEKTIVTTSPGQEGSVGEAQVSAYVWVPNQGYTRKIWALQTRGEQITLRAPYTCGPDLIAVKVAGCCGDDNVHKVYNVSNGKLVAAYSGQPLQLCLNGRWLLVSYFGSEAPLVPSALAKASDAGILSLTDEEGHILSRIYIQGAGHAPAISLIRHLSEKDRRSNEGTSKQGDVRNIMLTFPGIRVRIPIRVTKQGFEPYDTPSYWKDNVHSLQGGGHVQKPE